ncbi:MAG TPA: hypothetical protein VD788_08145, partial [Candidatus Polarisedimenticolaceae bacterium]|nr:hypothetical protein [Candidatus Polarisedimenticolaceae bacterium]
MPRVTYSENRSRASPLWMLAGFVCATGVTLVASLAGSWDTALSPAALALVALAGVAGAFPVRFAERKTAFTPTHPFILCALGAGGVVPAAAAAVAGVIGASLRSNCRITPVRVVFNTGAGLVAAGAAAGVFVGLGGVPGRTWSVLLGPLAGAASAYFLCNTTLVALAVALDTRAGLLGTWVTTFAWTIASSFAGFSVAVGLLVAVERFGVPGILLAVPPVAVLVQF